MVQLLQSPHFVPSASKASQIEVLRGTFRAVQHRRETSATPGDSEPLREKIETLELGNDRGKIEETDLATAKSPRTFGQLDLLYIPSKILRWPNVSK